MSDAIFSMRVCSTDAGEGWIGLRWVRGADQLAIACSEVNDGDAEVLLTREQAVALAKAILNAAGENT